MPGGVDSLDHQSFSFNSCASGNNVPPVANGLSFCDTIKVCAGDTVNFNVLFLSPEIGQNTTVNASTSMSGFTVITNTPGNTVPFHARLIAQASNVGNNTITLTASDNGT